MTQHKILSKSTSLFAIATSIGAFAFPAAAHAQGADAGGRDVITVTAQRREENLQDVPVAVTALSADQLDSRQIRDVTDLQAQIPNAVISNGTGTANSARIFFRGVGEDESRGAIDPAVGVYVDGVYLGRTVGSLVDLVDIEQVEVLRGPQGTLYGRNTNGGAIKITSVKPQFENSGDLAVGLGSDERVSARGTGNIALGDQAAFRFSGMYKKRDGFHRLNPNGSEATFARDGVGKEDVLALRGALRFDFNEAWSAVAAVDYTKDNSDPTPSSIIAQSDDPGVVTDVDGNIFTVEPAPGVTCASSFAIGCFTNFGSTVESFGVSLDISGDFENFSVSSLTSFRKLDDDLSTHISFPFLQTTDQDQFTQEVILTSDFDSPFNFVGGVYYYNEDVALVTNFGGLPADLDVQTKSFAVFGQATYDITDQLTLTGGGRFTTEDRDFIGEGAGTVTPLVASLETDNVTYTAKLDYAITDDVLIYGSFATGFKSPGFASDCFSAAVCYEPVAEEELTSYEAGLRSEFADGAVIFNATYFYNDYENLQISATLPTGGFTRANIAAARIQGVEVETSWYPVEGLSFYAHASWLDAEYRDLTATQAGLITTTRTSPTFTPGPTCTGITTMPGDAGFDAQLIGCGLALELKNAPQFKAGGGFSYTAPVGAGNITLGSDIAYEDDSFGLVGNNPGSLIQPGFRMNARIAYAPEGERWRVAVWAKNLTDREYFRATTTVNHVYAAPPRTWGVDLGVSF